MPRKCLNPTFIYFPTMWPHPKLHFRVVLTVASVDNCKEVNYQSKPFLQKWPWGQWGQKRSSKVRLFSTNQEPFQMQTLEVKIFCLEVRRSTFEVNFEWIFSTKVTLRSVRSNEVRLLSSTFFYKSENFSNTKSNTGGQNILFRGQNVKLWGQLWV